MKIVSVRVELKQGLPNYSSRAAEAVAVADESESLDIRKTVVNLAGEIKEAWEPAPKPAKEKPAKKEEKPAGPASTDSNPKPAGLASVPEPSNVVELKPAAQPKKKISNPLDDED